MIGKIGHQRKEVCGLFWAGRPTICAKLHKCPVVPETNATFYQNTPKFNYI
jgi:hypothetical protein